MRLMSAAEQVSFDKPRRKFRPLGNGVPPRDRVVWFMVGSLMLYLPSKCVKQSAMPNEYDNARALQMNVEMIFETCFLLDDTNKAQG